MTDEMLDRMKKRQQTMPRYGTEYKTFHKEEMKKGKRGMASLNVGRNRKIE